MNEDTSLPQLELGDLPHVFKDLGPKFCCRDPRREGFGSFCSQTYLGLDLADLGGDPAE